MGTCQTGSAQLSEQAEQVGSMVSGLAMSFQSRSWRTKKSRRPVEAHDVRPAQEDVPGGLDQPLPRHHRRPSLL